MTAAARRAAAEAEGSPFAARAAEVALIWRQKQLAYTWLRRITGHHADFRQVTQDALDWALEATGLADPDLRARLLALYEKLDAYPEVPAVLRKLRDAGATTAILSNGSPGMLASAVASAGIGDLLDDVLSVEAVGVYKPDPRVYAMAGERFGVAPTDVLFVSSNGWDVAGASLVGPPHRLGQPPRRAGRPPARPTRPHPRRPLRPARTRGDVLMPRFNAADGTGLHFTDEGEGLPVLALPGLTRNGTDFDYVAPHLRDVRLIRLDYRGRGQSDWADPATYKVPVEAADALALLDHLGDPSRRRSSAPRAAGSSASASPRTSPTGCWASRSTTSAR